MADTADVGINPAKYLEKASFNFISRGIGAIVRLALFFAGVVFYIFTIGAGLMGIIVWLFFPFIGIPFYDKYKKHPKRFALQIRQSINSHSDAAVEKLLGNEAGRFLTSHLGVSKKELIQNAQKTRVEISNVPLSFTDILKIFLDNNTWSEDFLRSKGLLKEDFLLASEWWDQTQAIVSGFEDDEFSIGRPGIGLELLFGYTPTLNKYSVDLSSPKAFSHHLIGRDKIVSRMERSLSGGSSVCISGQPGVGKKTVVLEFAKKAAMGELGAKMAFRRVLEFDYNFLLSDGLDLPHKKTMLSQVLSEAASAGNIILVIRDIHRLVTPEIEGVDFTDILEKFLEKRDLKIIVIVSNSDYERFLSQNLRLRKFLDIIDVYPPTREEAMQILFEAAKRWEKTRHKIITAPALRKVLDGSDRYISETPFPEKALELLDSVVSLAEQKNKDTIVVEDVNTVLSEKTGISFARLTEKEKDKLGNLEEIIHKGLVNQNTAVSLIAKSLRARSVGVRDEDRPIGTFLFLGPTGVGKTQAAKVLAEVYYGSSREIIRFDMAEYAGNEGLTRLIGSTARNQPGVLTTAIKNKPASLLLLDEIEKATPEVFNLLLTLLDEGYMTDAFGRQVSGRHLFIIATSNAGAEFIREQVESGVKGEDLQKVVVDHIQKQNIFSPELLNRFDGVVVFEPLTNENLVQVAGLLLKELSANLHKKGIFLEVSEDAARKLAEDGYDPSFGARPMRRIIDLTLGDLLGSAMLRGELKDGDRIQLLPLSGKNEYKVIKAE